MPRNLLNQGFNGRNLLNTGDGVTDVVGGDAIDVVETDNQIHTVNLKISKQGAASSLADTDIVALETSGGVIQKITGANLKTSTFSSNWTRSSGNIFPTVTGDTILANDKIEIDTLADATYLDSLILQNTNSGTDILTYSFQIKDAGSSTAPDFGGRLNFEVVYTKGGGSTNNVYEVTFDGFMRILKRLEIVDGFTANSGEDYDFPATGGTLVTNTSGSITGTSPIVVSTAGVVSTTFTPTSTTNMSGKTFTDVPLFKEGIEIKQTLTSGGVGNNSAFIKMWDKDNSNFILLCAPEVLTDNFDIILPTITTTTTLLGDSTTQNVSGKTFTDQTLFNRSLQVKNGGGGETNVSGSVRFFEKADNGTHYTDLHTGGSTHILTANRNVYLPDATGTIVLEETNLWEQHGSNKITPTDTSLTAIDLPNNCSIRNESQDNQFIKFSHTSSTNETIQLASNQVSIENLLVYEGNPAYYLKFGNGILDSTFTQIHIPADSYIINDADTTNDWIQFRNDELDINYANVDFKENVKLRNNSDTTNDFISLRSGHLYINYALTEVIEGGKIANGSDPTNDYIQFNNDELYINYANVLLKQNSSIKNASNSLSGFLFDSEGVIFQGPLKVLSEYTFPFPTRFPLEVEGYLSAADTTGSALYYQNVPSLGGRAIAINGDVNMSAKFEYGLYVSTGTEIWVASDERIKKDITTFSGGLDLLRQLEVKSYKYIDGKGKEPKHDVIGFIAQEVKEIYPKAITLNHEYIPNVYKQITVEWSDFDGKFKMKTNDLPNVVDIDYKFFCWNEGDKVETKVESIGNSDNTFTFNKKWENVFCIGNKVNDFNTLDKSSLYVINFSATKELDNIVKQQQAEIDELKSIINKLVSSNSFKDFKSQL